MTFIDEIYDFNIKAGLLDQPYSDFLESSFQIEEALEGFPFIGAKVSIEVTTEHSAKDISREFLNQLGTCHLNDVDRLDKAIDAIVFAVGSIAKLKLTPEQITRAISVVTQANLQKLSNIKVDSNGKLLKDSNFIGPEAQLQSILDERNL